MLTGVDFRQAIKYWTQGREVIVIDRSSLHASGGYDNFPFEDLFRNVELLADVPAVEDPEFRQAVEDMVHGSDQDAVDEKDSMKGELLPPPHEAGDRTTSGRKIKKGISPGAV